MADITSYIDYFELIAGEHKEIAHSLKEKHFFLMDLDELMGDLRSKARFPALVLLKLSGRFFDKFEDNRINSMNGGFLVVDHCKSIGDYQREAEIFDETFRIGKEIIARINYDHLKCEELALKAVPGFDPDRVTWEQYGPVWTNHFGTLFKFPLQQQVDLDHDTSKWDSIVTTETG